MKLQKNYPIKNWRKSFCSNELWEKNIDDLIKCTKEGVRPAFRSGYWDNPIDAVRDYMIHPNYGQRLPSEQIIKKAQLALLLELSLSSGIAEEMLDEQELKVARGCFENEQYESSVLKKLARPTAVIVGNYFCAGVDSWSGYFTQRYEELLHHFKCREVKKLYVLEKQVINKIASGVKDECFVDIDAISNAYAILDEELNEYIAKELGYDYNALNMPTRNQMLLLDYSVRYGYISEENYPYEIELLQRALTGNCDTDRHIDVIRLINNINERQGVAHAKKVAKYVFERIMGMSEELEIVIKNGLPLICALKRDELFNILAKQELRGAYPFDNEDALEMMSYPFKRQEQIIGKINEGAGIFERVAEIMLGENNLSDVLVETLDELKPWELSDNSFVPKNDTESLACTLLPRLSSLDIKAIRAFCPNYFDTNNVLARMYLKVYLINQQLGSSSDKAVKRIFEVFYSTFERYLKRAGKQSIVQLDRVAREEIGCGVDRLLEKYGLKRSNKGLKYNYVIAFLDRKVATEDEARSFACIEQLGDSIWGFAMAELCFYNPKKHEGLAKELNSNNSRYTQQAVATAIGLHELYFSPAGVGNADTVSHVIADSLEMLLGAISLEHGYKIAISVAKKMIREAFPKEYEQELRFTPDVDFNENVSYWNAVLPSACERHASSSIRAMREALDKLLKCVLIGTQAKKQRSFITQHRADPECLYFKESRPYVIDKPMWLYCHKGLDVVVERYSTSLKELKIEDE